MSEIQGTTMEVELSAGEATRQIAKAVSIRHSMARGYVKVVRRRKPDATPAEIIRQLELQYISTVTGAGAALAAAEHAADFAIKQAAKLPPGKAKVVAQVAAHGLKLVIAPADAQLQFEITAIFALSLADIHGWKLDKQQVTALVYGLSSDTVSQQTFAKMANDVASAYSARGEAAPEEAAPAESVHWAQTLAESLPAGAAKDFLKTMETGQFDGIGDKRFAAINYGISIGTKGFRRFSFGRAVVAAARIAFPDAPVRFPAHLHVSPKVKPVGRGPRTSRNQALAALEGAARTSGGWIADVGTKGGNAAAGVANEAAGRISRLLRRGDSPRVG
jgi:hypothetical protein